MSLYYYKIGEVADLLHITVRTIRYYEEEGLLEPDRTKGGTRLYTEQHLARLRAIVHLVENGFTLEVIRLISETRKSCLTGNEGSEKLSEVINSSVNNIENNINKLTMLKKELSAAKNLIIQCRGCNNKPSRKGCPSCPVNKNLKKIEILNLVWE